MTWEIVYYESPSGRCAMQEFLDGLHPKTEFPYVNHKIELLEENGNRLKRPHTEHLGDKIYELRIHANKLQFRCLYFFFDRNQIVFTHGIVKKGNERLGDKVDPKEIKRTADAREDYKRRHVRDETRKLP